MYNKYWGLKESPFENVPDPRFLYHSSQHDEALMRMTYAVKNRKGAAMLTGEIGCGKTLLSRSFMQQLAGGPYEIGVVANPNFPPLDFLKEVIYQFGIRRNAESKSDLLHVLNESMLDNMRNGRDTIIIVDEAQVINHQDTYEELRLLLNFQMNERFLLTLILIGQPDLRDRITAIPQFEQRIAIKYHLGPLKLNDVAKYLMFRLKTAGMQKNVFTKEAIIKIYEYTQGVPRRINNICDLALLVGFSSKANIIDSKLIQKLIEDRG
jgi:general secretion pathway protein A